MTTVAVTGVGGLLGRALLAGLRERPGRVARVLGLDVRLPDDLPADLRRGGEGPHLELRTVDVRDAALAGHLEDVDVVVHLAFQMDPIRDLALMRSINVDGTTNVLGAARAAGVGRVVVLSSVVAYGAHPDNAVPLAETSPLRGTPGFTYAEHKREVEELLGRWHAEADGPAVTVLRSAAVLGPGVQNFFTRILELPVLPAPADAPPLQFVHVDDVVGAILHAVDRGIDGAYNVAPDGWLDFAQVLALVGRRTVPLDHGRLRALVAGAHRLGVGELEPGVSELFRHPWVLSNARLRATGWRPTRSSEEALLEAVVEHAPYLSLGRLRVARRTAGGVALALGATAVAVSAAALRRR